MSVNVYDPVNDRLIPVAGATLYGDAPVGSIIAFAGKEINLPEGYLAFNGQTVKRGDYPDLWAFAVANEQVGVDKFFSQGDGSTTFTLADLRETSLKGYGETSRSVGAHVKSGGLGVGEFIDDQLQKHIHGINFTSSGSGNLYGLSFSENKSPNHNYTSISNAIGRTGATTEVKAVGVVWAVKAKMTGLPIDLKEQVEKVEEISGTTNGITYHVRKNNSVVCIDVFGKPSTASSNSEFILTELPSNLRPKSNIVNVTLNCLTDTVVGGLYARPSGRLYMYLSEGRVWNTAGIYGGSLTYIV